MAPEKGTPFSNGVGMTKVTPKLLLTSRELLNKVAFNYQERVGYIYYELLLITDP